MARPMKDWRTKTVKGSLLLFQSGEYVGSIPYRKVYQMIKGELPNGKPPVLVNPEQTEKCAAKAGSGKLSDFDPGGEGTGGEKGLK